MSDNEKFDLRSRIILHGNQGVNGEYLRHSLKSYLSLSSKDFKKIEEKPESSRSLRELRLLVGRNILRDVHTYLEETNHNQVINNFPLYLFSVWYDESTTESSLGERKGISLIPYVPFRYREDIFMSTLCRTVVDSPYCRRKPVGKWFVNNRQREGCFILSEDVRNWVESRVMDLDIPGTQYLLSKFDWEDFGSFYLWGNMGLFSNLIKELDYDMDLTSPSLKDNTTRGLRVRYTTEGDFHKETGCLRWKVKEEPSNKGECGELSSSIFKIWTGLSSIPSTHLSWWRSSLLGFNPWSFNASEYKEKLKLWL